MRRRTASTKDCVLEMLFFPTPFLLTAPKETVSDRQRKALTGPSVRPSMDRRTKLGYFLPPAPLPLMPRKAALSAAHNRAPGGAWPKGSPWRGSCPPEGGLRGASRPPVGYFLPVQKVPKDTLRGKDPGETTASKGRKPSSQDFSP